MNLKNIFTWEEDKFNLWIWLITLIFLLVIYQNRNYIRFYKIALSLDGLSTHKLLNVTHFFNPNGLKLLQEYVLHKMVTLWVYWVPYVMIIQPELIQKVLSNSKHSKKPFVYSLFRNYLGKGLITSDGERYKLHVNILRKAFDISRQKMFNKIFVKHAEHLVSNFRNNVNQDINITRFVNDTIYNIQAEAILNLKYTENGNQNDETSVLPYKVNKMHAGYRLNRPWLMKDWLYGLTKYSIFDNKEFDTNYAYCYDIIKKIEESKYLNKGSDTLTKDENNQETNENISMVEYMINVKQTTPNFNYNDILDEVGTFMLAGLESVSTATALGLFQLANHPEWQEKCYEELNEIFNDLGTLTSTNSLNKMKYLDMCIKETLRLYPTVPIIGRCLSKDTDFDGITVPAGSDVFISPYITHRIPDYYPDPESYQPERFESDNFKNFRPCVYIPFGAGSRKCIGYKYAILEMKVIFSTILRNFILEPAGNNHSLDVKFRMTLRAKGGVWIKFRPREMM